MIIICFCEHCLWQCVSWLLTVGYHQNSRGGGLFWRSSQGDSIVTAQQNFCMHMELKLNFLVAPLGIGVEGRREGLLPNGSHPCARRREGEEWVLLKSVLPCTCYPWATPKGCTKVLALFHISDHGMLISSKERSYVVVQNAYYRLLGPRLDTPWQTLVLQSFTALLYNWKKL